MLRAAARSMAPSGAAEAVADVHQLVELGQGRIDDDDAPCPLARRQRQKLCDAARLFNRNIVGIFFFFFVICRLDDKEIGM